MNASGRGTSVRGIGLIQKIRVVFSFLHTIPIEREKVGARKIQQ